MSHGKKSMWGALHPPPHPTPTEQGFSHGSKVLPLTELLLRSSNT